MESNLIPITTVKAMILFKNNGENPFSFLNHKGQRRTFLGVISGDTPIMRIKPAEKYLKIVEDKQSVIEVRVLLDEADRIATRSVVDPSEFIRIKSLIHNMYDEIVQGAIGTLNVPTEPRKIKPQKLTTKEIKPIPEKQPARINPEFMTKRMRAARLARGLSV